MKTTLSIDGQKFRVEKDKSLLTVLRSIGIKIPSLCYHPALKPGGICRLCTVEVAPTGKPAGPRLACITKVREDIAVITQSPLITAARSKAIQALLKMAPQSDVLLKIAAEFNLTPGDIPDGCIRCRLCIGVCREVVGADALKMVKRNGRSYVVPIEGRCIGGATCVNICPTGAIKVEDRDNVRTLSIRGEIIGRHPLERCEGCGKYFEASGFLKKIGARTAPHPEVKTPHRYCPACAKLYSDRVLSFRTLTR